MLAVGALVALGGIHQATPRLCVMIDRPTPRVPSAIDLDQRAGTGPGATPHDGARPVAAPDRRDARGASAPRTPMDDDAPHPGAAGLRSR
jgi:hypothetical protein